MSELNFNDLPIEIMSNVFRFLDGRSLKNATLTCHLWNNLIESACRWSLELRYDGDGNIWFRNKKYPLALAKQMMNFILTTNRFNLVSFAGLINLTPNVKHVVLKHVELRDENELGQVFSDFRELKNMELWYSDYRILKCFTNVKFKTITLKENGCQRWDALVDFLSSQEMLTSLTIESHFTSRSILGKLDVPKPFRLTQLTIKSNLMESPHNHDNLLRFVQSQAAHLKELEIGRNIPISVYGCVFASMTELTTLSISASQIPRGNANYYDRLKENHSVRTIKLLEGGRDDSRAVSCFLKKLPNIRSVAFPCITAENENIFVELSQNLSQLESLSVEAIDEISIDCGKFPNLKSLHIQQLRRKINWNEFTKIHPHLTELIIGTMARASYLTNANINQITTNVDLQSVRLGEGFVADDRFFEIIRTKCTNLKVLDMHKSCKSRGLRKEVELTVLRLFDDI